MRANKVCLILYIFINKKYNKFTYNYRYKSLVMKFTGYLCVNVHFDENGLALDNFSNVVVYLIKDVTMLRHRKLKNTIEKLYCTCQSLIVNVANAIYIRLFHSFSTNVI